MTSGTTLGVQSAALRHIFKPAETKGGAGPSWSRVHGTTSADVTAAAKAAGGARPLVTEQYGATIESELAETGKGDPGSSRSRALRTTSAAATTAAKSGGEVRPPGVAKYSATSESELAKFSDGAGSSRTRATGATSADTTAVAKSVGEARPLRYAENCDKSKPESDLAAEEAEAQAAWAASLRCPTRLRSKSS